METPENNSQKIDVTDADAEQPQTQTGEATISKPAAPVEQPKSDVPKTVSTAADFKKKAQSRTEAVNLELPSGLVVGVIRPSVTTLIKTGHIPSDVAAQIQNSKPGVAPTGDDLVQYLKLVDIITRYAVKTPHIVAEGETANYDAGQVTLDDFEDVDKSFILQFVQSGVTDLATFRNQPQS